MEKKSGKYVLLSHTYGITELPDGTYVRIISSEHRDVPADVRKARNSKKKVKLDLRELCKDEHSRYLMALYRPDNNSVTMLGDEALANKNDEGENANADNIAPKKHSFPILLALREQFAMIPGMYQEARQNVRARLERLRAAKDSGPEGEVDDDSNSNANLNTSANVDASTIVNTTNTADVSANTTVYFNGETGIQGYLRNSEAEESDESENHDPEYYATILKDLKESNNLSGVRPGHGDDSSVYSYGSSSSGKSVCLFNESTASAKSTSKQIRQRDAIVIEMDQFDYKTIKKAKIEDPVIDDCFSDSDSDSDSDSEVGANLV